MVSYVRVGLFDFFSSGNNCLTVSEAERLLINRKVIR